MMMFPCFVCCMGAVVACTLSLDETKKSNSSTVNVSCGQERKDQREVMRPGGGGEAEDEDTERRAKNKKTLQH